MDREKIIKGLEFIVTQPTGCSCAGCPMREECDLEAEKGAEKILLPCEECVKNALALLKEQETDIGNLNETVKNLLNAYTEIKAIYGDSVRVVGELVRCRDCKHWLSPGIGYKNADLGWCMGRGHGLQKSDFFCADGERKEGR